jgi:hypothetical protein
MASPDLRTDMERKAGAFDTLVAALEGISLHADQPEKARVTAALILVATIESLRKGGSSIESQLPILDFLGALRGLQQGHRTWLTEGLAAKSRRPPEDVGRIAELAHA